MKHLFLFISILYSTVAFNQTYCIMVDQDDGFKEYLGIFDISSGNLEKVSTSNVSSFVNNGTSPIIDPVNGKYVYLTSNPLSVEIIDLESGEIETSFNYSNSDTFPRHLAYNISDSSIYCLKVDKNNGGKEYLSTFDIATGTLDQISTSSVSSLVNNGTTPIIHPEKGKYIYLADNPLSVKIIDLDSGEIDTSFIYSNSDTFPRHFAYNILDSSIYCLKVDKNNGSNEYLSTFDISTGRINQISPYPVSSLVNNGTTPIIDPEKGKYIYLTSNPGPVKVIDLNSGEVISSFDYDTGFFPRHFAYTRNNNTTFTSHNAKQNIDIYPNPASDQLIIKSEYLINEIKLFALNGKLLRSFHQNVNSIDVSNLSNGLYFIRIHINGKIIVKKFIKN